VRWLESPARRDCLFLAAAVVLSFAWYVPRLGFYSDDWAFLGRYAIAPEQTISGFYKASMSPVHAMRPVQVWLCAALYRLFGMEPLGYHLFNGVLLIANAVLLYAIAWELRAGRIRGLALSLIYALLPNYSTDRYWYLAFAITLSMTCCLASIYADLKAVTAARGAAAWKVLSVVALIVSALSYEVALPLFLLAPVAIIWRIRGGDPGRFRHRLARAVVVIAISLALVFGAGAFKLHSTVRLGAQHGLRGQVIDIARKAVSPHLPYGHYGLNVFSAAGVHFGDYGVELPFSAWALGRTAPAPALWLTGVFALLVFGYLSRAFRESAWPSMLGWSALIPIGLVVFGLGYAIFLTNYNVQFTPTGISNRSAIAATLGAAIVITGTAGWLVTWLVTPRLVALAFAALVTLVTTSGFLAINALASKWVEAYGVERRILADVRRHFPSLPPNSTLLLDGACPYIGPAIVFESYWDLAGALQFMYRDETLLADVVTPQLQVNDDGLSTSIYSMRKTYPYSTMLVVYDAASGAAQSLPDAATARAYFGRSARGASCPTGQEGMGVRLF
jgi:hypothetical protein